MDLCMEKALTQSLQLNTTFSSTGNLLFLGLGKRNSGRTETNTSLNLICSGGVVRLASTGAISTRTIILRTSPLQPSTLQHHHWGHHQQSIVSRALPMELCHWPICFCARPSALSLQIQVPANPCLP